MRRFLLCAIYNFAPVYHDFGMASRSQRATAAAETVAICQRGNYVSPSGDTISITNDVAEMVAGTRLYRPGELPFDRAIGSRNLSTTFDVTPETTLAAARRLVGRFPDSHVAALNFASAKNPGGGFLNGSLAQEESLAVSSGLYPSLITQQEYYDANRATHDALYTDHVIFSPRVPVFRDDDLRLMNKPYQVSMITAPAPNAGAVDPNMPGRADRIANTLWRRMNIVLNVAIHNNADVLILGAWGCGVFKNDVDQVAGMFHESLGSGGLFHGAFHHICFAVYDRGSDNKTIGPFRTRFGGAN